MTKPCLKYQDHSKGEEDASGVEGVSDMAVDSGVCKALTELTGPP